MIPAELSWYRDSQSLRQRMDDQIADWLFDHHSLTQRLRSSCQGEFSVELIRQCYCWPRRDERRVLQIKRHQYALVREVILRCNQIPMVVARSTIPLSTLHGRLRRLKYLQERPLGEFLFSDPDLNRGPIEVAQIPATFSPLTDLELGQLQDRLPCWGRRSIFHMYQKPLLVSEIFLPSLLLHKTS